MADLIIELTSDRLTGEKNLISCIWGFYIHTKGFQKVRFEAYMPPWAKKKALGIWGGKKDNS